MNQCIWLLTLLSLALCKLQSKGYVELQTQPTTITSCLRPQTTIFSIKNQIKIWNNTQSTYLGTFKSQSIKGSIVVLKCRIAPYTSQKYHYVVVIDNYNNVVVWQEQFNSNSGQYKFTEKTTLFPTKRVYDVSVSPSYIALNYQRQIQIFDNNLLNHSFLIPLSQPVLDLQFNSHNDLYILHTHSITYYVNFNLNKTINIKNYTLLDFQLLKGSQQQIIIRVPSKVLFFKNLDKPFRVLPLNSSHKVLGWKSDNFIYINKQNQFILYQLQNQTSTNLYIDNIFLFQCTFSNKQQGVITSSLKQQKYVIQQFISLGDQDDGVNVLGIIFWVGCCCFQCVARCMKGFAQCFRGGCCNFFTNICRFLSQLCVILLNLFCLIPTQKKIDEIQEQLS